MMNSQTDDKPRAAEEPNKPLEPKKIGDDLEALRRKLVIREAQVLDLRDWIQTKWQIRPESSDSGDVTNQQLITKEDHF